MLNSKNTTVLNSKNMQNIRSCLFTVNLFFGKKTEISRCIGIIMDDD